MNVSLVAKIGEEYLEAADKEKLFSKSEGEIIFDYLNRERMFFGQPNATCNINLFFGFFFDGTRNNYIKAEPSKSHSNVARLYDCFPGQSVPGVLPKKQTGTLMPRISKISFAYIYLVSPRLSRKLMIAAKASGTKPSAQAPAGVRTSASYGH